MAQATATQIANLRKQGKIIDVTEGYTRYIMTEDGRVFREGTVRGIRSKFVWIDDEGGMFYMGILDAYEDRYGRELR